MADSGIINDKINVTDAAAVPLFAGTATRRRTVWIHNLAGSDTVYIGGAAVTAADGYPVPAGTSHPIISGDGDTDAGESWHAICGASDTAELRVLAVTR